MSQSRKRRAELEPAPRGRLDFRDPRSRPILLAAIPLTIAGAVAGAVAGGPVGAIAVPYFVIIGAVLAITRLEKAQR